MRKFLASTLAMMAGLALCLPAHAVRVTLTAQEQAAILNGALAADAAKITWTAADAVNFQEVVNDGKLIILAWNQSADTDRTVTVTTVKDALGRTGDITAYQVDFASISRLGPFPTSGFNQTNGKLYFQASHADIKFAVIRVNGSLQYR